MRDVDDERQRPLGLRADVDVERQRPLGLRSQLDYDRQRPLDYEVFSLTQVVGIDKSGVAQVREFKPLYARYDDANADAYAYYSTRRTQRVPSEQQRLKGPRSGYIGCHALVSSTGTFSRAERRRLERDYAARTRAQIAAAGQWPADLAPWDAASG